MAKKLEYEQNLGNLVLCDMCNAEWQTDTEGLDGFVFGSKAVCPTCAPEMLKTILSYKEERYIVDNQLDSETFANFIRRFRGADACIRVYSFDDIEDILGHGGKP